MYIRHEVFFNIRIKIYHTTNVFIPIQGWDGEEGAGKGRRGLGRDDNRYTCTHTRAHT